jgi:AraC-like DNA-binding protein
MYDIQIPQNTLYYMLYGAVTMAGFIASCYLLLRRANAIAPDVTPPIRLRRWTAALCASLALANIWYLPLTYADSPDVFRFCAYIGLILDFMICFTLAIVTILVMLQDRRRPLWTAPLLMVPPVLGTVWCMVSGNDDLMQVVFSYILVMGIGIIVYMIRAVRQYDRWLQDNYADLEHKEVSQSLMVLAGILFMLEYYVFGVGTASYEYVLQIGGFALYCFLVWRVETLSDLSASLSQPDMTEEEAGMADGAEENGSDALAPDDKVGTLLRQHCIDTQLYLQHDLTLAQFTKTVGVNRLYLSRYLSSQGMTYNAYINDLRISHFIRLYRDAVAANRSFTAQQLASESGYRSYSTFSLAFKQRMGQTVTAWMRDEG